MGHYPIPPLSHQAPACQQSRLLVNKQWILGVSILPDEIRVGFGLRPKNGAAFGATVLSRGRCPVSRLTPGSVR